MQLSAPNGPRAPLPLELAALQTTQADGERLMAGAGDGTLNSRELVALGNYRLGTQEMLDGLGPGPLSTDQARRLAERLIGFDHTLDSYRSGEYSPPTAPDATLQTPEDVFRSVPGGSDSSAAQLVNSITPWDGYARLQYRLRSAPEMVAGPRQTLGNQAPPPADPELARVVNDNFSAWDRNHDGSLRGEEVTQNMEDPRYHGREAAALATLKRHYESLSTMAPEEGISQSDWDTFSQGDFSLGPVGSASWTYQDLNRRNLGVSRPLAEESFEPRQIHQSQDGSCVLLATMHGLKPDELRSMVHDDGNGVYTIHFADGRSVQVPEPTDAQRLYSQSGDGERWPALFELGARHLLPANPMVASMFAQGGIDPHDAMLLLTGRPLERVDTSEVGYPEFRQLLQAATEAGGPVIAGTGGESYRNGLVPAHEYAVLGFDSDTNQVTLRNPHGHGEYRTRYPGGITRRPGRRHLPDSRRRVVRQFPAHRFPELWTPV